MFFTLFYMYATLIQWWRLGSLKNKINGTLNSKNALLLTSNKSIHETRKQRSLENLLFQHQGRIACTVVPKQYVNLSYWVVFPKDSRLFPIYFQDRKCRLNPPFLHVLVRTVLDTYTKHDCEIIRVEDFGELVAWKASSKFEVILKTDLDNLTKLVHQFSNCGIDINHELELLEAETIHIDGAASKIKYDRIYPLEETLKYSCSSIHWKKFSRDVKELYSRIRDATNPKIKIENGTTNHPIEDISGKKVPIYEVKPMKKDSKRHEDKNTLDVVGSGDHRRHKTGEHSKREKSTDEKHRSVTDSKEKKIKEEVKKSEAHRGRKNLFGKYEDRNKEKSMFTLESTSVQKDEDKDTKIEETRSISEEKSDIKETLNKGNGESVTKFGNGVDSKQEIPIEEKVNEDSLSRVNSLGDKFNPKPPNILIYADSLIDKENVKGVLRSIVNNDKYLLYDLPTGVTSNASWSDSTALVVICGGVPPELTSQILQYLLNGGRIFCLCSDLLHSVLNTFTTAEVREHELVRFTYGEWRRVKMMHHIFCYQASPAKKQFSKDSEQSNHSSNGSSPIAPRTPSSVEIVSNGKTYKLRVQVLGAEETWQTPSLLLATVKESRGLAVFSQVHLEIDPLQYEGDERKFAALKDSNQARLEILTDILSNRLNIDCVKLTPPINYTAAYFLGRHDLKMDLLAECDSIVDDKLTCDKISLKFFGKNSDPGEATETRLPVLIHSCPSNFNTVEFFSTLETDSIGRLVIYADIMTSSQNVLSKPLKHGLVVIPRQQSMGIGRQNNVWISPIGGACFSLQLHIPLSSPLGRCLSIVQHLISVSVINAIKAEAGYESLNLGIKWPNDLYANGNVKIGGLTVNTLVDFKRAILNIGCGVNLSNPDPTKSVNEIIQNYNKENNTYLAELSQEKYFALVFNEIERLYDIVQNDNLDYFFDLYYQHWIHSNAEVTIETDEGRSQSAKVIGIDDFGFLKVRLESGEVQSVHPDGNTFDMMKGLIAPKHF